MGPGSPFSTAAVYTVAGLAAGSVVGLPKVGAAIGLGMGLRRPGKGKGIFDRPRDPRALSRAALEPGTEETGAWWDVVTGRSDERKVESWEMGKHSRTRNLSTRLRQGSYNGTAFSGAPSSAKNLQAAKLAAGFAYKHGRTSGVSERWSVQKIAFQWPGAPWANERSILGVLDAALKSGISVPARAYLIGVRGRSMGAKAAPGVFSPWTKRSAVAPRTKGRAAATSPRAPQSREPSGPAPSFLPELAPGAPAQVMWWEQPTVRIGAAVVGGVMVLGLLVTMMRR
jgi:hypothetical protein